ncbi:hypothetical protein O0L34_g17233 [Tuta absoluta]|nr:hypothetical protein O0L34_g17233 [Tuta absoluta]
MRLDAQQDKLFFRRDYMYLSDTESFYKIHTLRATWQEAKRHCELEGAVLFHAKDADEADTVIAFWNQTHPTKFDRIYVGMSDLLVQEVFQTLDGHSTHDAHNNWRPGEPNNAGATEHCVEMFVDGTLNDVDCHRKYVYICKKALKDLQWNKDCDFPRNDYSFNETLDRCYKFHSVPKNWTEAMSVCHAEQSHLAVTNSLAEADFLVQLARHNYNDKAPGLTLREQILLGFHNRLGDGWKTIKDEDVAASGYAVWSPNQPSGDGPCGGLVLRAFHGLAAGHLNDIPCNSRGFFVCEHEISSRRESDADNSTYGYEDLDDV